jgi:hypothetical protein
MPSIVPPLDFIPKLPARGAEFIIDQLNQQLDQLTEIASNVIQESVKLPGNIQCDDPRIKKLKEQLAQIQEIIQQVQAAIPVIQQSINAVKQIVNIAQGIKATIAAAQLSNPQTAALFIALQLQAIQDATIVNAIASLNQFATLPTQLLGRLQTLLPPLIAAIAKIGEACNGEAPALEVPDELKNANITDYNDLVNSEFYNELNVSDSDLTDRSGQIEQLLQQQQDLLTSLQEAPSKVYQQAGIPPIDLGKTGDYYIDTTTNTVYGPKVSATNWGNPVN